MVFPEQYKLAQIMLHGAAFQEISYEHFDHLTVPFGLYQPKTECGSFNDR